MERLQIVPSQRAFSHVAHRGTDIMRSRYQKRCRNREQRQGKSMTSDDLKKTSKDILQRVGDAGEEAKSSAQDFATRAADKARDLADRTNDAASNLYDHAQTRVRDAADRLPDAASDALSAGQRAYRKSSRTVAKQVVKQPIEALLLAGAIGYLVGWATSRS